MTIKLRSIQYHVLNMKTRMPFHYGIASLTRLPHLIATAVFDIDGSEQTGIAAEGLPPKWFTKDPETHFQDDLPDLFAAIVNAFRHARDEGEAKSPFALWKKVYSTQARWAKKMAYPPLLWSFGVSVFERAMIDAVCKAKGKAFSQALKSNLFELDLSFFHRELKQSQPCDWLPDTPLNHAQARHTVGLADPIEENDIAMEDRIDDGLPQSLDACIAAYGLQYFKIKVKGDYDADRSRLLAIDSCLRTNSPEFLFTLDGNEQFTNANSFKDYWTRLRSESNLSTFFEHLIFVEQPVHRSNALSKETARTHLDWTGRPPMIIDESDGELDSLRRALDSGYIGTSHKNCKGVFKGIANACHASRLNREGNDSIVLSGEDLANVGPVALLQDLAAMASLGIQHIERNGHHYFKGLSMWPETIQQETITQHSDLYNQHDDGFACLKIENGSIHLDSVNQAPFGCAVDVDASQFIPLDEWTFQTFA